MAQTVPTTMLHVPHVPHLIKHTAITQDARHILDAIRPQWPPQHILYQFLTDGLTNVLVRCRLKEDTHNCDVILIRIYGNKTDMLIDRDDEKRNILLLYKAGIAPTLYATFENGLAYEYLEGCTLTPQTVVQPHIYKLVAARMAQMHSVQIEEKVPVLWTKFTKFLNLLPEKYHEANKQARFECLLKTKFSVANEVEFLKANLSKVTGPLVCGHNDLLLGNVIYNKQNASIKFIDFEYTGCNYQAFDIGNHFCEFVGVDNVNYALYPNKEFQCDWLREYLTVFQHPVKITEQQIHQLYVQVNKFALAAHVFWGLWSLIQAEYSDIDFDYLGYAAIRFDEYFKRKEEFLNLT